MIVRENRKILQHAYYMMHNMVVKLHESIFAIVFMSLLLNISLTDFDSTERVLSWMLTIVVLFYIVFVIKRVYQILNKSDNN